MTSFASEISVIIPAYNAEAWIVPCLNSILKQTLSPLEILVVDDDSSDETAKLVREFMINDNRIQLIQLPEKPAGKRRTAEALNTGINEAKGNLIALMDADDIALPHRLQKQLDWLERNPDVAAVGAWVQVITEQNTKGQVLCKPEEYDTLHALLPLSSPFYQNTVMFRAEHIRQHGLLYQQQTEYAEDYEFFSRMARVLKVGNVQEVLVYYRQHAHQSVRNTAFASSVQKTSEREFSLTFLNMSEQAQKFWQLANHRDVRPVEEIDKILTEIELFFKQLKEHNPKKHFDVDVLRREVIFKRITSWPQCSPKLLYRLLHHVKWSFLLQKKEETCRFVIKCLLFYDQSG